MRSAPLTRKDLERMACLTRVESFVGEGLAMKYRGRLGYEPEIGRALVFIRDDGRRVITSTVVNLESSHEGELLVETMNSRYRLVFLARRRPQA